MQTSLILCRKDCSLRWTMSAKFPRWGGGSRVIFGRQSKRSMTLKLGMWHWVLKYYQIYSNDDPELTLTYFTARSNLAPYTFVWEKGKTADFSETSCLLFEASNRWPRWQEISVDIKTLSPGDCKIPAPGLYTCINSWKKMYKIRLQRDFFETGNKLVKW